MDTKLLLTIETLIIKYNYIVTTLALLYAFILGWSFLRGFYGTFNINIDSYLGFWDIIFRTLSMTILIIFINSMLLILTLPALLISYNFFKYTLLSLSFIILILLPFFTFNFSKNFAKNIYNNKSYLYSTLTVQGKTQNYKFIGYLNGLNFYSDLSNENILIVQNQNLLFHKFDSNELKKNVPNHIFSL